MSALRRRRSAVPGEHLSWEGEASPLVGIVCAGMVALTVNDAQGDERIVGLAHPGTFIGRPFGGETPYGLTSIGEARLCVFARDAFDRMAAAHAGIRHQLLTSTLDELERSRRWLMMLGRKTAGQKVAAFLLDCAREGEDESLADLPKVIALPFSRQQIADILGLTIETVSREFTELRNSGAIGLETSRRVHLLDPELLIFASGEAALLH